MMQHPVAAWHAIIDTCDAEALGALLADDATFHSPVVHTPQVGKALTMKYLGAALQVFLNVEVPGGVMIVLLLATVFTAAASGQGAGFDLDINVAAEARELLKLIIAGNAKTLQQKRRAQPWPVELHHLHADGQFADRQLDGVDVHAEMTVPLPECAARRARTGRIAHHLAGTSAPRGAHQM